MTILPLALKGSTSPNQFFDRVNCEPKFYEFHLTEEDMFGSKRLDLINRLKYLQAIKIKATLHYPFDIAGVRINAAIACKGDVYQDTYIRFIILNLMQLAKEFDCKIIMHYGDTDNSMRSNLGFRPAKSEAVLLASYVESLIDQYDNERNHLCFENNSFTLGAFYSDCHLIDEIASRSIPTCLDFSHAAITIGLDMPVAHFTRSDRVKYINDHLEKFVDKLKHVIKVTHVVDSNSDDGIHDSLITGQGVIEWYRFKDIILNTIPILEVGLKDVNQCNEMLISHTYLEDLFAPVKESVNA